MKFTTMDKLILLMLVAVLCLYFMVVSQDNVQPRGIQQAPAWWNYVPSGCKVDHFGNVYLDTCYHAV